MYQVLSFLRRLLCLLPDRVADALATAAGWAWYALAWRRRRVAKANLANAFPGWRHRRVCRTALGTFEHFARSIVEFLRQPLYMDPAYLARRVGVLGEDRMRAAFARGRGVILLLAHWGNWEIGGLVCNALGYPHSAVGRAVRSKAVMRFLNETRARGGTRFIDKHRAVRPVLAALRAGECVGFFVDQTTSEQGCATTFFGRVCETPRGPAGFALKVGAPIVPIMCPLLAGSRYEARFYEPVPHPGTGDFRRDVDELTQRLISVVEARVRERPEQWLWMHRRWKPSDAGRLRKGFRHVETILVVAPDEPDRLNAARPVVAYLRSLYPHARLTVLVTAPHAASLDGDPHVDEVIEAVQHRGARGWLEAARTIRRLRRRYFHLAVLLSGSSRSALWAALAGIPIRVGSESHKGRRLLTHRAAPAASDAGWSDAYMAIASTVARAPQRAATASAPAQASDAPPAS